MSSKPLPLVNSSLQVRLLAATALISGIYTGWIFGKLDIEDVSESHRHSVLLHEELELVYPLSLLLGGATSFFSAFYRSSNPEDRFELKFVFDDSDGL